MYTDELANHLSGMFSSLTTKLSKIAPSLASARSSAADSLLYTLVQMIARRPEKIWRLRGGLGERVKDAALKN